MFSVIFPGQGSQTVGMGKKLYNDFKYVKELFVKADDILNMSISKIILEGPNDLLNDTENTQPAIFLVSQSIYEVIKKETKYDLSNVKYFAGHSLGEYSALCASGSLTFDQAIKLLKVRGKAMQSAVPKGKGGMLAVLGVNIEKVSNLINENTGKYKCFIANDNSNGQIVLSGLNEDIDKFIIDLKKNNIKNIKLPVSAPFHCKLMNPATNVMKSEIEKTIFNDPTHQIISNVTAKETKDSNEIKSLLIKQIENPVKWRESVIYMIDNKIRKFIEIGPGKVLSGLIRRIDKSVDCITVNEKEDLLNLND